MMLGGTVAGPVKWWFTPHGSLAPPSGPSIAAAP